MNTLAGQQGGGAPQKIRPINSQRNGSRTVLPLPHFKIRKWSIIIVATDEAEPPVQIASRPAPRGASHLTHLETGPTASLVPQVSETSPPMRFSAAPDVR